MSNIRPLYMSMVGLAFLSAFLSYYVQYPGLLSSAGISPLKRSLPVVFPYMHSKFIESQWVDSDSLCDFLAFAGVSLSSLSAFGLVQHGVLFIMITYLYFVLTTLGQDFYAFQWDSLIRETGIVTALCYAPWGLTRRSINRQCSNNTNAFGAWPLRFLLFKLMFMSGVVKIQADCPTWKYLTALEYHFATQCLPGPLAWHAQQLHPLFLRASVAMTFIIEIPAAFFLIAPFATLRRFGAYLQIILQVVIILTGNYNFFNLLTIALCLPCMEDDQWFSEHKSHSSKDINPRNKDKLVNNSGHNTEVRQKNNSPPARRHVWWVRAQKITGLLVLVWAADQMFDLGRYEKSAQAHSFTDLHRTLSLTLAMSKTKCDDMINYFVPLVIPYTLILLLVSILIALMRYPRRAFSTLLRGIICVLCIGAMSAPFLFLTPQLQNQGFVGSEYCSTLWQKTQPFHIFNSYGLFRRMTGVGSHARKHSGNEKEWGWAGLPPSVVSRPEIILEGVFNTTDSATDEWRELNFRWKPGSLVNHPLQVAPHQPRLDWQMWFAALGNYQHNPWLISLMDKLLDGCYPVIKLLNEPSLLTGKERLLKIRAKLWHYDFTRLDTEWNRKIPGIVKVGKPLTGTSAPDSSFWKSMLKWPDQYWTREMVREYIPALEPDNPSVKSFLVSHGHIGEDVDEGTKLTCQTKGNRCRAFPTSSGIRLLCTLSESIRNRNLIWSPVVIAFLIAAAMEMARYREWYRKGDDKKYKED